MSEKLTCYFECAIRGGVRNICFQENFAYVQWMIPYATGKYMLKVDNERTRLKNLRRPNPANIYLFKVNNRNNRCEKYKMWNMFKVNSKNTRTTSLTYFTPFSSVSIVDFEQVNVSCKVGDKDTRTTIVSFRCIYCQLWTYSAQNKEHNSSVFILESRIKDRVKHLRRYILYT